MNFTLMDIALLVGAVRRSLLCLGRARYDWPRPDAFYAKLREVAHPGVMACRDKYYCPGLPGAVNRP